ncbi:MAG: hypothetical protein ACSLFI_08130 [Solirubrobacterales bacterium]
MNATFDRRMAGLLLVAVGWALCLALTGSPEVLLFTAPVFLLAAPLAFGRYVGEDLIKAAGHRARTRRPKSAGAIPVRISEFGHSPISSLLIASNLAGRAPPAAFA